MKPQEEIKKDKRLMFKNSYPTELQLRAGTHMMDGYITLTNGHESVCELWEEAEHERTD